MVESGVEIANTAGEVLGEINGAVKKVTSLVSEISAASQEQLSSVGQIDQTLTSLDENTQKNAALVEEAASATEELSAQAQELNSIMEFFKIDNQRQIKPSITSKHSSNTQMSGDTPYSLDEVDKGTNFSDLLNKGEFDEF